MNNKTKKYIKIFVWSICFIFALLFVFFTFIGPRMIVVIEKNNKTYAKIETFNIDYQKINLISHDGYQLNSLYCKSNTDTTLATVIFIHGIRSKKEYYLERAEEMANQGFATLLIDLRAHGESEGKYCTYGYHEVSDIQLFIDTLEKINNNHQRIGIWGQSLGGALSLLTLAQDQRLNFGIIESTYANFNEIVKDYSFHTIGFRLGFINDYVIWRAKQMAQFDDTYLHPENACKKITQPILMVHGTNDEKIVIEYAYRNFEALNTNHKTFLKIEGANHNDVWKIGGNEYSKKVYTFIKASL